jgi:hypothetical protein
MTMKMIAACAVLACATGLFCSKLQASSLPPELQPLVPAGALGGQAKLSVWGFEVYNATLWVAPGFLQTTYEQHAFALELAYLRDFAGSDIAKRSVSEMRRQKAISPLDETRWEGQMRAVFPDVKAGERLTGVNLPGVGAQFRAKGRVLGEIRDPEFAKLFFGIWLSPQSSEPRMRQSLLAQVPPVVPSTSTSSPR